MPSIDPAWIALIGTVCGGVGLKLTEHWLGRNKVKADEASQIRNELRQEITTQREEIKQLENDVDKWKKEYYDLRDKYMGLETDLRIALQKIKEEAEEAEERARILQRQPPVTDTTLGP